ncbi:helix-turn-helix transcriptional regulator [Haliscomenobacter sp.]|uniref:LexA family transcriptional regulator n=1 Tax=Haliscomenobacter sp. TaxID=2717303 RepID=UPI003593B61E
MNSIVTQRFIQCHHQLKQENRVRSSRQFALALDYLPQSLSEILKGRRDVTIDLLRKAVEVYQVNPIFLYTGEGELFLKPGENKELRILTIVTDQHHDERILHIPCSVQPEYVQEIGNPEFIQSLPSYSLPSLNNKTAQRSFDINGDSMEPTFFEGDKVVCSFIEPNQWEQGIKNQHVYVLVSKAAVVVNRVRNELKEHQHLKLYADNSFYESHTIHLSDIQEVWQVHTQISAFLPARQHHHLPVQEDVKALRQMLGEQQLMIQRLHNTIEKLVNS